MTTKLVSANMGIVLIVEKDGKQETKQFSLEIPRWETSNPLYLVDNLLAFLNTGLECNACFDWVKFPEIKLAKSKKIKARQPVSQKEFNKKIKELGY